MIAIGLLDVALFWAYSIGLVVGLFLLSATLTYFVVVARLAPSFREDILVKFADKKRLRSGSRRRFLYPYLTGLLLLDAGVQATFMYRISHAFARHHLGWAAEVLRSVSKVVTNIDIAPRAEILPGISFFHGSGVVIGKGTTIGRRVIVCQGVTTGTGRPRIGDDVILWAGAKVIGDVTIGDRSHIGANAVVLDDVPPDSIAVGVPARRLIPLTESDRRARRRLEME